MNTSSRVGQCSTMFSILSLFNHPLNEAACPQISTVYSPIMPSEVIYTLIRAHLHDYLYQMRIILIRLEGLTRLVALENYKLNTGCRAEKLPNEHDLFSQ